MELLKAIKQEKMNIKLMTPRENIVKVLRREGVESVPVDFVLCDSQIEDFKKRFGHDDYQ